MSSGLNVPVTSVSRALTSGIGKQQRNNCVRDSRERPAPINAPPRPTIPLILPVGRCAAHLLTPKVTGPKGPSGAES